MTFDFIALIKIVYNETAVLVRVIENIEVTMIERLFRKYKKKYVF